MLGSLCQRSAIELESGERGRVEWGGRKGCFRMPEGAGVQIGGGCGGGFSPFCE